ncbi:unnamed protein product [Sphenostylis stenocarpa]|uniref:Uncharacterized protein n=1 Tax=Sphenostylis stenocarpa TaxID=92480 RepID=A0AA86S914_9FABA|nr:unnamed protein product [Sphenostylis stenocarpa]
MDCGWFRAYRYELPRLLLPPLRLRRSSSSRSRRSVLMAAGRLEIAAKGDVERERLVDGAVEEVYGKEIEEIRENFTAVFEASPARVTSDYNRNVLPNENSKAA